jgi:hypothetical protein
VDLPSVKVSESAGANASQAGAVRATKKRSSAG